MGVDITHASPQDKLSAMQESTATGQESAARGVLVFVANIQRADCLTV